MMDPFYTYHGTSTKASDLHQEGALLNRLSGPCMDAGASLLVVNHMNQAGRGMSLKRITMAGSGEWADSWLLVEHRKTPDVTAGTFHIGLEVGSRQWGGSAWDLDLEIGRFDEERGTHDGEIRWDLCPRAGSGTSGDQKASRLARMQASILEVLADKPWSLSKTALKDAVGGSREAFDLAFTELIKRGEIEHRQLSRSEAGTTKKRILCGLAPTPAD
jgi:hypothetical protein